MFQVVWKWEHSAANNTQTKRWRLTPPDRGWEEAEFPKINTSPSSLCFFQRCFLLHQGGSFWLHMSLWVSCCPVTHRVSNTTPEQISGTAGVMRAERGKGINSHEEKLYLNPQTTYVPVLGVFFDNIRASHFHILHVFCKTIFLLHYYFSTHFHEKWSIHLTKICI